MNLEDVRVGDYLAVESRWGLGLYRVTRMTATRVEAGGTLWRKSDGRIVGAGSGRPVWARLATPEDRQAYEQRRAREALRADLDRLDFNRLTPEHAAELCKIVKRALAVQFAYVTPRPGEGGR